MKTRLIFALGLGLLVLLLIGGGVVAWRAVPVVLEVSPPDGAEQMPVGIRVQITFSRPMRAESVQARLKIEPARTGTYSWQGNMLEFTPDLPWPDGTQVLVTLQSGARAAGVFGMPVIRGVTWSFTTNQALLAYLWPANSLADIYTLDPLSGEVKPLTQGAGVSDFSISPDGQALYFSASNAQGGSDIFRIDRSEAAMAPEGMAEAELVRACQEDACRFPQPSAGGHWLAYELGSPSGASASDSSQVWLLNLTSAESRLAGDPTHLTRAPAWSALGWLAFYDDSQQSYVILNPETGETHVLFNDTGEAGSWATGGKAFLAAEILYVTGVDAQVLGSSHLILYDIFGSQMTDLTRADDLEDATPAFSPDGKTIAFSRKYLDPDLWTLGRQFWLMNSDGSNQRRITNDAMYKHHDFAWSWDGRWLAFVRFNQAVLTEPPELWLVNADGSNAIQLVIGGFAPEWIP